jgi:hypothetical protein
VGRTSALGLRANLGQPTPYEASLWHNRKTIFGVHHANNEFEDDRVLDAVSAADADLGAAGPRAAIPRMRLTDPPAASVTVARPTALTAIASAAQPKRPSVVVTLTRQLARQAPKGRPIRVVQRPQSILGGGAFSVTCGNNATAALPIGPSLYFAPAQASKCSRPLVKVAGATPIVVNIDDHRVRARIVQRTKGRLRVDVTGDGSVRAASIRAGVRIISGRRHGRIVRITLAKPKRGLHGILTARVGQQGYQAPLHIPIP